MASQAGLGQRTGVLGMGCAKPGQLAPGTHMCEQHSLPREPEEHLPGVPGSVLPLSAAGVPDSMGVCTRARALSLTSLLHLCSCNSDQSRCPFQCERASTDADCSSRDTGRGAQHRPSGRTEQLPGVRVRQASSPSPRTPNLLSQVREARFL